MSKTYEHLTGARGRARFFRPRRYAADELFAGAPPRVWFEDTEFSLENISATGIGCRTRDFDQEDGEIVGDGEGVLRLTQLGREIFRTKARMARAEMGRAGLFVGLALDHGSFELDDLVKKNAGALAVEMAKTAGDRADATAPLDYKSYCADVLAHIGRHLDNIDTHFAPIADKLDDLSQNEIAADLARGAGAEWRTLLEQGNDLVLPTHRDKRERFQLKKFTERVVTRELVGGESWARSYYKPMGYPGDYRIMNFMYDGGPRGDNLRSKFLHMLGVIAGQPIVTRMEKLAELIMTYAEKAPTSDSGGVDIMSVGCGPARELELLHEKAPQIKWRATLIDQETEALDYALTLVRGLGPKAKLTAAALNISFKEMLDPATFSESASQQDIIYSSGLVDYLNPLLALRFVRRMYDYLKPGGMLIIGNVNDLRTGTLWPMEYVLDWTLYFRSAKEMLAMAEGAPDAVVTLERDPLDAIYFLVLKKPIA